MLCLRKFPVAKNSMDRKSGMKIFRRKLFVLQCRNFSLGNTSALCSRKFPVAKNYMDRKSGMKIFRRKLFVLQCRKIS